MFISFIWGRLSPTMPHDTHQLPSSSRGDFCACRGFHSNDPAGQSGVHNRNIMGNIPSGKHTKSY